MIELKKEYGIAEFLKLFTEDFCKEYLFNFRWSDGKPFCTACGSKKVRKAEITRNGYRCNICETRFNLYTSSLFGNTKIGLSVWFLLIYLFASNKKNISAVQNARNLGVTGTTSWKLMDKIRSTFHQDDIKLSGEVEIDEAFISKSKWRRVGDWSRYLQKPPVLGLFERGTGKVVMIALDDRKVKTIAPIIQAHVIKGSTIYTDAYKGYQKVENYTHAFVKHRDGEFVRGNVHTNNIEGCWSFFKRNIKNSHHSISNKHLQAYLNEGAFKWNNKHLTQMERFNLILKNCIYG